jgi:hypothetical protein
VPRARGLKNESFLSPVVTRELSFRRTKTAAISFMQKRMSIQLGPVDREGGRASLGALLEQAVTTICPSNAGESDLVRTASWISRWAIRAVCEEIIRTGEFSAPLKIQFVERNDAPAPLRSLKADTAA